MFWGLILEPNRRYTQVVTKPFHITMAAMDETTSDAVPTQVILSYQERNYLLCTLKKGEIVNVPLDLNFDTNDQISFASNGNSHIHLTGYLIEEDEAILDSDSEEDDMVGEVTSVSPGSKRKLAENGAQPKKKSRTLELLENVASDDESDDESVHLSDLGDVDTTVDDDDDTSDDDDEDSEEEEDDDEAEDVEAEDDEDEDIEAEEDDEEEVEPAPPSAKLNGKGPKQSKPQKDEKPEKASKKEKRSKKEKLAKEEKTPQKQQQPQSPKKENGSPKKEPASPVKKIIENGVTIEDLKVGQGPPAKFGKVVHVYYEGRLKSNNKMFDSSKKGPGFEFRLGRKEVIKGWDVGVQGMKVGGKRRITCPPNMAYGNKGSPPVIPPNATLVFEVELKKVL